MSIYFGYAHNKMKHKRNISFKYQRTYLVFFAGLAFGGLLLFAWSLHSNAPISLIITGPILTCLGGSIVFRAFEKEWLAILLHYIGGLVILAGALLVQTGPRVWYIVGSIILLAGAIVETIQHARKTL